MALNVADIRTAAITRTLFPPTTLGAAVGRLGLLQADPIAAPARAQDLILRHRVPDYRVGDLEQQYPLLDLDEGLIHVYGFMASSTLALLHPRAWDWQVEREFPGLAEQVLEFVKANGETDHRALEVHFGAATTRGNWGSRAKATTKALEMLQYHGLVRVARRMGLTKRFVATTPPSSGLEPAERLRRLVLLQAGLYAPITLPTLRTIVRCLRWSAPDLDYLTAVADLLKSGDLVSEKVDGVTYVWPAGEPVCDRAEPPRMVRLLAPFDPVVWDRARFEQVWGWAYRFEAYTPAAKRQWGHYALPLLWVDRVVGWANLGYAKGRLDVDLGFVAGRPADPDFGRELEAELERMRVFLGGREA